MLEYDEHEDVILAETKLLGRDELLRAWRRLAEAFRSAPAVADCPERLRQRLYARLAVRAGRLYLDARTLGLVPDGYAVHQTPPNCDPFEPTWGDCMASFISTGRLSQPEGGEESAAAWKAMGSADDVGADPVHGVVCLVRMIREVAYANEPGRFPGGLRQVFFPWLDQPRSEPPNQGPGTELEQLHVAAEVLAESCELLADRIALEAQAVRTFHRRQATSAADPSPAHQNVFRLVGDIWEVRFGAERGSFKDAKTFKTVADLLSHPNPSKPVPATRLAGYDAANLVAGGSAVDEETARRVGLPYAQGGNGFDDSDMLMDRKSFAEAERKLRSLEDEYLQAKASGGVRRQEELREEMRRLVAARNSATGLGGKPRRFRPSSPPARALESVDKNLRRAYQKMRKKLPGLVAHLEGAIQKANGGFAYRPSPVIDWQLS